MRIFVMLLIFACSCKEHRPVSHPIDKKINLYPEKLDSMPRAWLDERIEEAKLFNLSLLFRNPEEFELRIIPNEPPWLRFGMGKDILVFKLDSIGWSGYHYYSFTVPLNDQDGKTMQLENTGFGKNTCLIKKFKPTCGWSNFSDSIAYYKVETIPTQELIKDFDYKPMLDGYGYDLEISRPNSYRYLVYRNLRSYDYQECKTIEKFMEMVKRQLGENYHWPEKQ